MILLFANAATPFVMRRVQNVPSTPDPVDAASWLLAAVWEAELRSSRVIDLDSNPLGRRVELHVDALPWSTDAEDLLEGFFVLYWGAFPPRFSHHPR